MLGKIWAFIFGGNPESTRVRIDPPTYKGKPIKPILGKIIPSGDVVGFERSCRERYAAGTMRDDIHPNCIPKDLKGKIPESPSAPAGGMTKAQVIEAIAEGKCQVGVRIKRAVDGEKAPDDALWEDVPVQLRKSGEEADK